MIMFNSLICTSTPVTLGGVQFLLSLAFAYRLDMQVQDKYALDLGIPADTLRHIAGTRLERLDNIQLLILEDLRRRIWQARRRYRHDR